jgi:hypothetical protein
MQADQGGGALMTENFDSLPWLLVAAIAFVGLLSCVIVMATEKVDRRRREHDDPWPSQEWEMHGKNELGKGE